MFYRWLCRCVRRSLRLEGKGKVGVVTKRFEGRWYSNEGIPKPKLPDIIHFGLCELCQTYISKTQRNRLPLLSLDHFTGFVITVAVEGYGCFLVKSPKE